MKYFFSCLAAALFFVAANAQQKLPMPLNVSRAYQKLQTRSESGEPGKRYWQNKAVYTLHVNYNPATRLLNGNADIVYTNNSPDTLRILTLKIYQNLYKRGQTRLMPIDATEADSGVVFTAITVNGKTQNPARLNNSGTVAPVGMPALNPGQQVRLNINYHYTLNRKSHIRNGEIEEGAAFIAYFFPRIAVYDDIDGWDNIPHLGPYEFYNDFCDFTLNVTVPQHYQVWATGTLQNCNEVMQGRICDRIAAAEKSDAVQSIIDTADLRQKNIGQPGEKHTWKFTAENVTDACFAVSDHYVWQAASVEVDKQTGRRTRADAVYNPRHKDFEEVCAFGAGTVKAMSYDFPKWPFPYPHITVFDGLDQMEYPMMVNDNPVPTREDAITLTDHEIMHTFFPFYMGINETKYAFMDEGWATIGEWIISSILDSTLVDEYSINSYERVGGLEKDLPIITPSYQTTGETFLVNSYPKPALAYLSLKDMLGDALFYKGLHHYMRLWNGKHPLPWDFFNCMNTGTGRNLNWYWHRWFFENSYTDLGIAAVSQNGSMKTIKVANVGGKPISFDTEIEFADGSKTRIHQTAAVWEKGNTYTIALKTPKKIKRIVLNGLRVPDTNRADNIYVAQ